MFTIAGADYVYLLGLYLGDGAISPKNPQLKVWLDAAYPEIVVACAETMERIAPNKVSIRKQPHSECFQVYSGWKLWPVLFPQTGPGKKHLRTIELTTEWSSSAGSSWDRSVRPRGAR